MIKPGMLRAGRRNTLLFLGVLLVNGCAGLSGEGSGNNAQQDSAEAVRLKAVLLDAEDLAGSAIDVTVGENRILLEGFVEKSAQRRKAENLIRENSDTGRVTNRIQVK